MVGPPLDCMVIGAEPAGLTAAIFPLSSITTHGEVRRPFDSVYSALGDRVRSDLARDVGARLDAKGCPVTNEHLRISIPGLYAAGDVVAGLDQISVAMGHAAIATTAIRNLLPRQYVSQ